MSTKHHRSQNDHVAYNKPRGFIGFVSTITMSDADGYETVKIPRELYKNIATRLSGSTFASVDEWILRLVQSELEAQPSPLSREAEHQIMKRLKSLGYE